MEQIYRQVIGAHTSAHQEQNGKTVQLNVAGIWKEMKAKNNSEQITCAVIQKISRMKSKSDEEKGHPFKFLVKANEK